MPTAHAPHATAAAADPLTQLNPAQRTAVVQGVGDRATPGAPLLVIAGAGSGKTNTLAHRVAHLIAHGADPGRILLLTFSRRAADEMGRRVRRILTQASAGRPGLAQAELHWSGTFHAIGARLLRDYAGAHRARPRLHHPRPRGRRRPDEPGAPRAGPVGDQTAFSAEGQLPCDLLGGGNYTGAAGGGAAGELPWCAEWEDALKRLFRAYVDAKQAQQVLDYDDLLLYWAQMVAEPALA